MVHPNDICQKVQQTQNTSKLYITSPFSYNGHYFDILTFTDVVFTAGEIQWVKFVLPH